jgi:membrane-associated phospholipid phosphatase
MTAAGDRSRLLIALAAVLTALTLLAAAEAADLAHSVDSGVLDALVAHRSSWLTKVSKVVTDTGASPFTYPVVVVGALIVGRRTGRWRAALAAPVVLVLGVLSRLLLSIVVRDERPSAELQLVPVSGFSFPSGHAAASALLAGALVWLIAQAGVRRPLRLTLTAVLALWALLVATTRLYLGVHWITDVVGSWLLAAAWLILLPLVSPGSWRLFEAGALGARQASQERQREQHDGQGDHEAGAGGGEVGPPGEGQGAGREGGGDGGRECPARAGRDERCREQGQR